MTKIQSCYLRWATNNDQRMQAILLKAHYKCERRGASVLLGESEGRKLNGHADHSENLQQKWLQNVPQSSYP